MAYFKILEQSQTWECPKTGDYKVICVGGGGSSGLVNSGEGGNMGTSTSFGEYLTASPQGCILMYNTSICGFVLHNPLLYATNGGGCRHINNDGSEHNGGWGYGAGGAGSYDNINGRIYQSYGGVCGELKMGVFRLAEGDIIPCTVGAAGAKIEGDNNGSYPGSDGAIIIQEV